MQANHLAVEALESARERVARQRHEAAQAWALIAIAELLIQIVQHLDD